MAAGSLFFILFILSLPQTFAEYIIQGKERKRCKMSKRKWTIDEIDKYRKEKKSLFYFNKEDGNLIVPKAFGRGRTFNWANPLSWLFMVVLFLFLSWYTTAF
jgi:uncharacterized membrane protein